MSVDLYAVAVKVCLWVPICVGASLANAAKPHLASLCAAKRRTEREAFCPRLAGRRSRKGKFLRNFRGFARPLSPLAPHKRKSAAQSAADYSLSKKYFSASCEAAEKVTRCPFLHPEGVQWYSERVKKGQIYAKSSDTRCVGRFSIAEISFFRLFVFILIRCIYALGTLSTV